MVVQPLLHPTGTEGNYETLSCCAVNFTLSYYEKLTKIC